MPNIVRFLIGGGLDTHCIFRQLAADQAAFEALPFQMARLPIDQGYALDRTQLANYTALNPQNSAELDGKTWGISNDIPIFSAMFNGDTSADPASGNYLAFANQPDMSIITDAAALVERVVYDPVTRTFTGQRARGLGAHNIQQDLARAGSGADPAFGFGGRFQQAASDSLGFVDVQARKSMVMGIRKRTRFVSSSEGSGRSIPGSGQVQTVDSYLTKQSGLFGSHSNANFSHQGQTFANDAALASIKAFARLQGATRPSNDAPVYQAAFDQQGNVYGDADAISAVLNTNPAPDGNFTGDFGDISPSIDVGNRGAMNALFALLTRRSVVPGVSTSDTQVFDVELRFSADTHNNQASLITPIWRDLNNILTLFRQTCIELGIWADTTWFLDTEFGRGPIPNSLGTDHGEFSNVFVGGGSVRGGHIFWFPQESGEPTGPIQWRTTHPAVVTSRGVCHARGDFQQYLAPIFEWAGILTAQEMIDTGVCPTLLNFPNYSGDGGRNNPMVPIFATTSNAVLTGA